MTFDTTANLSYSFDQENRLTGSAGYTYTYDGDGNRVRKSNGNLAANGTLYWAMTPGVVAETDLAGTTKSEYIFFDGERVARRDGPTGTGGVFYYFSDHLKTASVVTDAAGTIKAESDYYPWGGELQFTNNDSNHYKFTGKERDAETGLDYFEARYYSNALGRFITPDWSAVPVPVPYADLTDPQSLNQYSYVRNIPTVRVDADGHDPQDAVAQVVQVVVTTSEEVPVAIEPVIPSLGALGPLLGGAVFMRADPNSPAMKAISAVVAGQNQQTQTQNGQTQETQHASEPAPASGGARKGGGPLGPVKAEDAPGVTAGGQATDKQGRKLTGSGSPQINKTESNTREKAGNKALNQGSGKVEHRTPSRGKRHFHGTRSKGNKKVPWMTLSSNKRML
ncbi:MAG TPA: RHS repeat-associated core domain-containing protein [Candidatus Angelobacter sp.]|jgi:RHS repeat-associated protein